MRRPSTVDTVGLGAKTLADCSVAHRLCDEWLTKESTMRVFPKFLVVIAVLFAGTISLVATNSSATISTATCTASNLRLGLGPKVGPVVGEQSLIFTVTNPKASKCQVHGYPTVEFLDSKNVVLALHYTSTLGSTSPYVTLAQPRTVVLIPGSRAYFKVAKYRCNQGDAHVATSIIITVPGVTGSKTTLKMTIAAVRIFAFCKGSPTGPGQLVGVSPFEATAAATYANAPSADGALKVCNGYFSWPTRTVTTDVVTAVTAYYARKNLTPISIQNNRELVVPIATERIGVHWCLNSDGSAAGYRGAVPFAASSAVMLYVRHKPYPVTEAPANFVELASVGGVWKVVGEGTGP
jgi:hypothetical protein